MGALNFTTQNTQQSIIQSMMLATLLNWVFNQTCSSVLCSCLAPSPWYVVCCAVLLHNAWCCFGVSPTWKKKEKKKSNPAQLIVWKAQSTGYVRSQKHYYTIKQWQYCGPIPAKNTSATKFLHLAEAYLQREIEIQTDADSLSKETNKAETFGTCFHSI